MGNKSFKQSLMISVKKLKWVWFLGKNWGQNGPIFESEMLFRIQKQA